LNPGRLFEASIVHHWGWVFPAMGAEVGSYIFQALRWRLLLPSAGELSTLKVAQAIYAGLFVNEIAPLRFGEVVRAYLVSRWMSLRIRTVIPSMALERIVDAVWLAIGIGACAFFVRLPGRLFQAAEVLAVAVLVGTTLLLVFARENLLAIHRSRRFMPAVLISSFYLALQTLAFWMMTRAYDLPVSIGPAAVAFLIVHLGTSIPNAPANVGSYQFFTVLALTFFGIDKTAAAGFSIGVFVLLTAPLWTIGCVAFVSSGARLGTVRGAIAHTPAVEP
jgi:hypothetical protein